MPFKVRCLGILVFSLYTFTACGGTSGIGPKTSPSTVTSQLDRAAYGIKTLQSWYNSSTGLYQTTGWWNSANAVTVLADYARVSKSTQYNPVFANSLVAAQNPSAGFPGFINKYYDDEGWWALAWIDVYDLTGDPQYLSIAESIFTDMATGWDNVCGGGIWWSKDRQYKNAIANELFLSVASHLTNRDSSNKAIYLDWADKEWNWFLQSGMINTQNLINDGLTISTAPDGTKTCMNNGKQTWSYNQGVVLGGLAELSKANTDASLPQTAQKIATAAITSMVDSNGVMHDPCEPNCGADGVQFKGIFVRNLVPLNRAYPQAANKSFITTNATSIWDHSQGTNYQFGQVWSGPFDAGQAGSQISALDAIVSAAIVESGQ
jgi:predicted alpha-1,6-mannanase (GH76 family)